MTLYPARLECDRTLTTLTVADDDMAKSPSAQANRDWFERQLEARLSDTDISAVREVRDSAAHLPRPARHLLYRAPSSRQDGPIGVRMSG
jgi:hypothetical protein